MAEEVDISHPREDGKNIYKLTGFISGSFTERLNRIHQLLLDPVSELIKKKTQERSFYRLEFELNLTRLDQAPFIAQFIQKNVFDSIRQSHFLIADISPQFEETQNGNSKNAIKYSPNPSVMHEIGYAMALNIPVFLIGEKGTRENLPANLRGSLVIEYDSQINKNRDVENVEELITPKDAGKFANSIAENIVNAIRTAGTPLTPGEFIIQGYSIRRKVNLPYLIRDSRYRVYILTTNLQYINSRLKEALTYALKKNINRAENLDEAPNKSFKVDILTMDPESIVTNIRAKELNRKVFEFREELRKNLDDIKNLGLQYDTANFEIGIYVSLPTLIMFVIDDTVIISVPFSAQRSRLVPHFIIANDSSTIQQFIDYFFIVKSRAGGQTLL